VGLPAVGAGTTLGAAATGAPTGAGAAAPDAPTGPGALSDSSRGTSADAPTSPGVDAAPSPRSALALEVGHDFGARYHIIRILGAGGMGAVYQAWDKVLEVAVAVKVIRPDATLDPETAKALERRFKRELLLARQVTHRNVVRIHDLGEIDGITYITMPYVQGADLLSILKRQGRLPVDRALGIARQVASGLGAAHGAGVVHRDLKPANIMVDAEDGALIMDFGIARSTSSTGFEMTAAGAVVGTLEYMAPEQARGGAVDQRADVYSFGLILYDMLLGRRHASGSSAVAELMARMQNTPASIRTVDPALPEWLDVIVTRCLQPDPLVRYQSIADVLADLEAPERAAQTGTTFSAIPTPPPKGRVRWAPLVAAAVALAAVAGVAIWTWRDRPAESTPVAVAPPTPSGPAISIAILPFRNASGDPTLDSLGPTVSQVLGTLLGQSSQVRTVPSDRLHQVLQDLRIASNAALAPTELARVADFTKTRRVLWGQYARFGDQLRIDATLQDLDRSLTVPLNAMAANESDLPAAVSRLADAVREDLARGSPDILAELKSTAWKPSTSSFEALRLYEEGQRLTQQGGHQEALKRFEAATKADPSFALGFSALAMSYASLGYDNEAGQSSRRAMTLGGSLPPQEKYRVEANHYRLTNDTTKAIESYENLAKAAPNNAAIQFDLGGLYEQHGDWERSRDYFSKVVELDPKYIEGLVALGRLEIRVGNFQTALTPLNAARTLAIELNNDEARGNILQAIGVAYKRLDRSDEALRNFQEAREIRQRLGNKRGMANSLNEIAQIQGQIGQPREAVQSYRSALALQREIGDRAGISSTLVNLARFTNEDLGRPDEALPLLREALQIRRQSGNPAAVAMVLSNIGSAYYSKGEFADAQTYFEQTLGIREKTKSLELADTLHNLGETLLALGQYDQSLLRYQAALDLRRSLNDRRGTAMESFSLGNVFDHQARYGAAVKAKEEALQTFRELKLRDRWFGEILNGYGNSLSLAGRPDEAAKVLDEAATLGRELQNTTLSSRALVYQTDRLYYAGDLKGASALAAQAVQAAGRAADRSLALHAQTNAAMVAAALQPTRALAVRLGDLAQQADTLGLKALSVDCSVLRAHALLRIGDPAAARQEIDRTQAKAEPLGFRLALAKLRYLRGEFLRQAKDAEAPREYAAAVRLLNEIRGEDGSQNVLTRADLATVAADADRWSKQP
jgi:serine/threonine protein kinase/Tfp pilus assembly protein PilF